MPEIISAITLILLMILIITRAFLLKRVGIQGIRFGDTDRSDYLMSPFALLMIYLVIANAFDFPIIGIVLFCNPILA